VTIVTCTAFEYPVNGPLSAMWGRVLDVQLIPVTIGLAKFRCTVLRKIDLEGV
jgi:hypothetical protein